MLRSWDFCTFELMLMSFRRNWRRLGDRVLGEVAIDEILFDIDVAVRCGWCNAEEEWFSGI